MMTDAERAALERLLQHAQRDTGQSRRVADFLLAWWNAGSCGGFDITTSWECDSEIVDDIVTVFGFAARHSIYPDRLGYEKQFEAVVEAWRPELTEREA
jgi:hypothetical protein